MVEWRLGALPTREWGIRLRRWPAALRLYVVEVREARAAKAALGGVVPRGDVVTVIPTYRRPELLVRAVRSALDQSIADHHIVVVADGEPVALDLRDDRLTVVALRHRRGSPALARNVGMRISRSRLVAFLDDDNTWTSDHLDRLVAALDGGAALAYSRIAWTDPDGMTRAELCLPYDRETLRDVNYVDASAIVLRRGSHRFFSRLPRHRNDGSYEDWEIAWRIGRRHRVCHVAVVTVNVTVHDGSHFMVADESRAGP